jgi:hypothetical protein
MRTREQRATTALRTHHERRTHYERAIMQAAIELRDASRDAPRGQRSMAMNDATQEIIQLVEEAGL